MIFAGAVGYDLYYSNSPDHSAEGAIRALGLVFGLVVLALILKLLAAKQENPASSLPPENTDASMGETARAYELSTDKRMIRFARYLPLLYLWMPVGAYALLRMPKDGFFSGNESPGMLTFKAVIAATALVGPILLAWFLVSRVPQDAEVGMLQIRTDGVKYRIGKHHADVTWSQVGSVHPVFLQSDRSPSALWLAKRDLEKLSPTQQHLLEKSMAHRIVVPKQLAGGMLLPLALFSPDDAHSAVEMANANLRKYHAPNTA